MAACVGKQVAGLIGAVCRGHLSERVQLPHGPILDLPQRRGEQVAGLIRASFMEDMIENTDASLVMDYRYVNLILAVGGAHNLTLAQAAHHIILNDLGLFKGDSGTIRITALKMEQRERDWRW